MKACLLIFSAFIVTLALVPTPVEARYCLRRTGSIGPGRCDFSTRQALHAHSIGITRDLQPKLPSVSS